MGRHRAVDETLLVRADFAGVSMDIGMSLLVINLMMTALARPGEATEPIPEASAPFRLEEPAE